MTVGKFGDKAPSDEAGCARDQYFHGMLLTSAIQLIGIGLPEDGCPGGDVVREAASTRIPQAVGGRCSSGQPSCARGSFRGGSRIGTVLPRTSGTFRRRRDRRGPARRADLGSCSLVGDY